MELVVGYRNGALLERVRRKERLLGIMQIVLAFVPIALAAGIFVLVGPSSLSGWLFVLFALIFLVTAVLALAGSLTPAYARATAPNGVAWVLRPDGVLIGQPHGPVLVPWPQVRIDAARVGGLPAVRVSGPGVEATYAEEYLSHTRQQLEQAAREISTLR